MVTQCPSIYERSVSCRVLHHGLPALVIGRPFSKALHSKPREVGALVRNGERVESALYLRDSVMKDGHLCISDGLSPVSHVPVDSFEPMPPVPGQGASVEEWEDFVDFFHWNKKESDWILVAWPLAPQWAQYINPL